ncbi:HelD family protein [Sporomusa malonica]|uniref:DNA helicase-2 / ATP-dependent DNA helicase PcrA n=1 Tax=Sporomusa malonica TaxID=112901 RepID=A0A1W2A6T9_9FIRM|nr:ATP-binding domain-containing protein [Sporomusa malonica]SMC56380.1 DNA helicase-2 / ATP-dependent DNA helicase PcrA [Sporomusa malonica]
MDQEEQQIELARLAETLCQVRQQIEISEHTSNKHRHSLQATMKEYWKAGGGSSTDEAQLIETMNRQRALSSHVHQTVGQLRKMQKSPYFGRIDFAEADLCQAEPIYIGIGSLADLETGDFLIYDWRAPVSSMFYDYGRGHASYHCPAGTIAGAIILKRQYKIVDGQIEYMFDSDLKIDDEILQQILGKSADDKMHTIVNSIQREQNQIIRDQTHKVIFVEGPAGSGKTSVALHRVAFLLYQDREKLTAQNVLILSPNHVFGDYISNVLPEIGEENVLQMTFQDYVSRSTAQIPLQFETRTVYLERMLAANPSRKRAANIRFKSSSRFAQVLTRYLEWLASDWINEHPALMVQGETIFRQDEWRHYYTGSFCMMPPVLRLEKIRTILQNRMRDLVHAIRQEKMEKLAASGEEVNEKVIKALARIQARDELRPITDQIEQLTTLDIVSEFKSMFKDDRLYLKTGIPIPDEWQIIKTQTLRSICQGLLSYEDIAPFLYFQGVLQGFPVKADIKHVVIDEAQDYTTLHYKILAQLFPHSSWTVVGDPAQLVQPFFELASFAEAGYILGGEQTLLFRLTKSYRSTREIQAFCQSLLPDAKQVQSVNRPGPLPTITQVENPQEMALVIAETVQSMLDQGWRSIGLIAKNAAQAMAVYLMLGDSVRSTLVTKEEDDFYHGIVIIPSYLAKGLEFDAVLVLNADLVNYSHEQDRHILYTICTRALHRLYLYYTDTLSPFIAQISKDLYQIAKV